MKHIGIDLEKLVSGQPFPEDFVPDCPGARVRITRRDYEEMTKGGERFRTNSLDIPADSYGDARTYCGNPVEPIVGTATGARMFYGLCHSCSDLEARNRQVLRQRAKISANAKQSDSKRQAAE